MITQGVQQYIGAYAKLQVTYGYTTPIDITMSKT